MANKLFHFNGVQAILTDIGISYKIANTIASASQAVDDFHEDKLIVFEDGSLFYPVVTAHKMLDPDNLDSRDASNIWMPFHFFPNRKGVCQPETENVRKLIQFVKDYPCRNEIEKQLMHGILLHIYVDTYTHEGFMGLHCKHNDISDLDDKDAWDMGWISGNLPPSIGHGEALSYPDDMWRRWRYTDNKDDTIDRDNQEIFLTITKQIHQLMLDLGYEVNELSKSQLRNYKKIFSKKGKAKNYEKNIIKQFDSVTKDNVGEGKDISYKKWKKNVMRKVQSKENKYIRDNSNDSFIDSKWVVFQNMSKNIRSFFKKDIFPNINIKTVVY
jgi:Family of unknown function (DUF6765)